MASQLALGVVRLNRRLRHADTGGLTPSLSAALASVSRNGEPTLGELAAYEHVAPATMTPIIKKLEERRLVTRVPDAGDGRVTRVRITAAGRRQLDENRSRRTSWLKAQLADLTDDERARLDAAVDVITKLTTVATEGAPS
jgi:DNA-binding MarR family transcriptional regulator